MTCRISPISVVELLYYYHHRLQEPLGRRTADRGETPGYNTSTTGMTRILNDMFDITSVLHSIKAFSIFQIK